MLPCSRNAGHINAHGQQHCSRTAHKQFADTHSCLIIAMGVLQLTCKSSTAIAAPLCQAHPQQLLLLLQLVLTQHLLSLMPCQWQQLRLHVDLGALIRLLKLSRLACRLRASMMTVQLWPGPWQWQELRKSSSLVAKEGCQRIDRHCGTCAICVLRLGH